MNNIICTGGVGFIGSHLVERLLKETDAPKIYIVDNLVRTHSLRNIQYLLFDPRVEFIYGDISTIKYETYFNPPDIDWVFHLAATRINRCNSYNLEGHQYIATGGARLIDWVSKYHIKIFFASSASVYQSPKTLPIKEEDPCNPHTIYGAGKLYTENLLRSYHILYGLEYVINRFFSVYGERIDSEGSYTEIIFNFFNQIKKGKTDITLYGNPDEKILDLIYVDDVVNAILLTMKKSKNDAFNVSTQTGITLTELVSLIESITNTRLNKIILPEKRTDIELKRIGDVYKLKNLGWQLNTTIESGLTKTWNWIKNL